MALAIPGLPSGMCKLNEKKEAEATIIDYLRSTNGTSNDMVAAFADCDELNAITNRKAESVTRYGAVLAQTLGEKLPLDRKDYVESAARIFKSTGSNLLENALTGAREAAATETQSGISDPKAITANSRGVLFQNADMVIIGMKQSNNVGGKTTNVASTAAMTMIGGNPVSVNLYAPSTNADANTFSQSVETVKLFTSRLIAANE
ncbi:MAG: hypothetical protein ACOYNL_00060 [Rickettsiales bacterium]